MPAYSFVDLIHLSGVPVLLLFEGEVDHKLPVATPSIRQMGFFRVVGRMMGSLILNNLPAFYGLSKPIAELLLGIDNDDTTLPVETLDIRDMDVRSLGAQMREMWKNVR